MCAVPLFRLASIGYLHNISPMEREQILLFDTLYNQGGGSCCILLAPASYVLHFVAQGSRLLLGLCLVFLAERITFHCSGQMFFDLISSFETGDRLALSGGGSVWQWLLFHIGHTCN